MCGLYAIINAIRLAAPLGTVRHNDAEALFRAGVGWLDQQGRLRKAVSSGLGQTVRWQLAAHLTEYTARMTFGDFKLTPLLGRHETALSMAFDRIAAAIAHQQPVLALLHESYHHYSVIAGIGERRLTMFDNYGYKWLERRSCSFKRQVPPTRHRFAPRALCAL